MKNKMFRKGLAVVIIVLFVGASITPLAGGLSIGKHSTETQLWESVSKYNNDTTPPVTNISLNGTLSIHGIFSSEVEVTLNATDDLSGVNVTYYQLGGSGEEVYNEPFMLTEHGWYALIYWSIDNAGNIEEYKSVHFLIDLIPPDIDLAWEKLDNKSIKFDSYTSDIGSGPYKVEYYIDNEYKHTAYWEDNFSWIWNPPKWGPYLVSGIVYDRGENTDQDWIDVYVPRVDSSDKTNLYNLISEINADFVVEKQAFQESSSTGNSIGSNSGISLITIKVDGEVGLNDWYVSDVGFNFTYESDDIADIQYWVDGGSWWTYTEPFDITKDGEDICLEWCAIDHEENYSDADGPFLCSIDQTNPEVNLIYEVLGWTPKEGWEFQFTATATDAMSGMDRVEFYFNNELQETVTGAGPEYVWTCFYIPLPGTAIHSATAYDKAGHFESDEIINPCKITAFESSKLNTDINEEWSNNGCFGNVLSSEVDKRKNHGIAEKLPSSNAGGDVFDPGYVIVVFNRKTGENDWIVSNVSIPIFYESDRIDEAHYQINVGGWLPYSEPLVFSDGIYVFSWYVVDSEGYTSTPESIYFKIDHTPPEINLIRERLEIGKVKFTANVYDKTSGIDRVKFNSDFGGRFTDYDFPFEWIWTADLWINWLHVVTATVFDKAGNSNSCSMKTWSSSHSFNQESSPEGLL